MYSQFYIRDILPERILNHRITGYPHLNHNSTNNLHNDHQPARVFFKISKPVDRHHTSRTHISVCEVWNYVLAWNNPNSIDNFWDTLFFGKKSLQKRYHNKHIITWSVAWHCQRFGISPPQLRYFWVNPICSETYDAASTPQHYRIKKQQLIVYSRLPRHNLSLFFLRHSPHSNTRAKRSATATGWMMCAAHSMPYASSLRAFSSYWLSLFYSIRRILWSRIKLEASSESNRSLCSSAQNSHKHTVQVIA